MFLFMKKRRPVFQLRLGKKVRLRRVLVKVLKAKEVYSVNLKIATRRISDVD